MRKIKSFLNIKAWRHVTVETQITNMNLNICILCPHKSALENIPTFGRYSYTDAIKAAKRLIRTVKRLCPAKNNIYTTWGISIQTGNFTGVFIASNSILAFTLTSRRVSHLFCNGSYQGRTGGKSGPGIN